ncbi:ATP-dependent nuclease [Cognatishimia activa]|uniref:Hemin importer ATP-binding subunit n=1 Tax=Cognatishimia activa TaxID=1715691 RepID=A0A0P1ITP3_9RHOB|nr:AAA family ATPase [Cognatishimia activa]CUI81650.1 hemin importer ATP-binding subunit [Cognatishimia activa]CUK26911.1 hemin importer ATP-binding subunit [Cognatishimia activa]
MSAITALMKFVFSYTKSNLNEKSTFMSGFEPQSEPTAKDIATDWEIDIEYLETTSWHLIERVGKEGEIYGYLLEFSEDTDIAILDELGVADGQNSREVSLNAFDAPEPEGTIEELTGSRVVDTRSSRAKRWSRLTEITVRNFKAAQEAKIPIGDVTILVGPNGCGKSSVLQAIHWAARAASYVLPKNQKEMISFERLDYIPSSEPLKTLHNGELKTGSKSEAVEVYFRHESDTDGQTQASVKIRAARNKGGITAYMEGGSAVTPYKQRVQFITAYIPGLAGLSESEAILAQPTLRRQASSGDAGGVLRNILYNLSTDSSFDSEPGAGRTRLNALNRLIASVHPNSSIGVSFDEREDFHISATIKDTKSGNVRPLETAATGILQVVQIFAYLILFRPKIMLIDEPDAHLHPDKQERLVEALEAASIEFETQIILTTHSPNIVRAASLASKLVWMRDGTVQTQDDEAIRRLLGWGGLDKSILLFAEDKDDKPLRAILRQWPKLSAQVSVCRCFGIENLPKDKFLEGLLIDGELKVKAGIHRDGDFMTEDEAEMWRKSFSTDGVYPWVTAGSDLEGYFCSAKYLSALYGISEATAEEWRTEAASNVVRVRKEFFEKRKQIMRSLWPDGGCPKAEDLWQAAGEQSPATVKGKKLHKALKPIAKKYGYDDALINSFTTPKGFTVAPELYDILEKAIAAEN